MSQIRTRPRVQVMAPRLMQVSCPEAVDATLALQPAMDILVAEQQQAPAATANAKLAALEAIAERSLTVQPTAVDAALRELCSASTIEQVSETAKALDAAVEQSHRSITMQSLAFACGEASKAAGFTAVDAGVARDGTFRVVAEHVDGRALVSEIRLSESDRSAHVETEVLGQGDPLCEEILDRFDAALETQGVQLGGAQDRRPTGGQPALRASREFLARRPLKRSANAPTRSASTRTRLDRIRAQNARSVKQRS